MRCDGQKLIACGTGRLEAGGALLSKFWQHYFLRFEASEGMGVGLHAAFKPCRFPIPHPWGNGLTFFGKQKRCIVPRPPDFTPNPAQSYCQSYPILLFGREPANIRLAKAMDLRLRRVMGMLKLGKATEAAEAAAEALSEAGQPPLAAVSVAARVAAAGAKSLCEGEAEEEALDELTALKVWHRSACRRCCSVCCPFHT